MSPTINELAAALAKAQAEMEVAKKDSNLSHFKSKYADLNEIVRVSRPCLTKHGLSVVQPLIYKDNVLFLKTILMHASGQYIESEIAIVPQKAGDQELGKSITYLRRYAYASLIGVVCDEELDHDNAPKNYNNSSKDNSSACISQEQISRLKTIIAENFDDAHQAIQYLLGELNVPSIDKIPINRFHDAINLLQ